MMNMVGQLSKTFSLCTSDNFIYQYFNVGAPISPYNELIAYEYLWSIPGSSLKNISNQLNRNTSILPSTILAEEYSFLINDEFIKQKKEIQDFIDQKIQNPPYFSILLKENPQYPDKLLDTKYLVDLLYYRGNPDLANRKCISVVGTRNISDDGIKRTKQIVRELAKRNVVIVSGLARGTDTIALHEAIQQKCPVIGVIGTPIDEYYPRENKDLQELIATEYLLISQVPFYKYKNQPFESKKIYFIERDVTMSALSDATIIVEASDTSGTLKQARACIEQGRKLFILNSCFELPGIKWPSVYEKRGAIRVRTLSDIFDNIEGL